jgi:hypothetical protein
MITQQNIQDTWQYIVIDHNSWPLRFWFEVMAWVLSIACSFIMMMTVPTPPFFLLYPMWIAGCSLYAWAAWTRGSFGMLANYVLLTTLDTIALARMFVS